MEGWCALAIAILCNVPTETAFSMLDKGTHTEKRKWTEEDIQYMNELKKQGMCWRDIAIKLNTTKAGAQRAYQYYKSKEVQNVSNRNTGRSKSRHL